PTLLSPPQPLPSPYRVVVPKHVTVVCHISTRHATRHASSPPVWVAFLVCSRAGARFSFDCPPSTHRCPPWSLEVWPANPTHPAHHLPFSRTPNPMPPSLLPPSTAICATTTCTCLDRYLLIHHLHTCLTPIPVLPPPPLHSLLPDYYLFITFPTPSPRTTPPVLDRYLRIHHLHTHHLVAKVFVKQPLNFRRFLAEGTTTGTAAP
ncbi:unnamed protein product, partial [Closterium sp. Naga37s-1]